MEGSDDDERHGRAVPADIGDILGLPPELAAVRAASFDRRPRSPETAATFDRIVQDVVAPRLKAARFTKSGLRWRRSAGGLLHSVNILRRSVNDYLPFTILWEVQVPGRTFAHTGGPDFVPGRIGDFFADREDRWWSIQLGWLARETPDISANSDECLAELALGTQRIVERLDCVLTLESLAQLAREHLPIDGVDAERAVAELDQS